MKYALLFISNATLDAQVDEATNEELYREIFAWFDKYGEAGWIVGGAELEAPETASTVLSGGEVRTGPFAIAADVLGGYTLVDVPDRDTAVAMAQAWPSLKLPGHAVEVRPVIDHG